MRKNLVAYQRYQVFLNYPFDGEFLPFSDAMHFAVVAAGLLPLCARDISTSDRPRLDILVDAISNCHYSAHELSKSRGEGEQNLARMNMPIEMGMALFHALHTQRIEHRCTFFVPTPHEYQAFASDLAGIDPKCYAGNELTLLSATYEWLRDVVPGTIFNSQPTVEIQKKFLSFKQKLAEINGSAADGSPSHDERRELMYQICAEASWWDWRETKAGREEFPPVPISWHILSPEEE